jgi:hypothetical protein
MTYFLIPLLHADSIDRLTFACGSFHQYPNRSAQAPAIRATARNGCTEYGRVGDDQHRI